MPTSKSLDLVIQSEATLNDASRILHDAVFAPDSWLYDDEQRCFRLSLWREVPEVVKREKLFLFVNRISFQRAACQFVIHHVKRVSVTIKDKIDWYSVFHIRYFRESDLLVFETEGAISIEASIEYLDCRLSDTGETSWKQYGYSFLSWKNLNGS